VPHLRRAVFARLRWDGQDAQNKEGQRYVTARNQQENRLAALNLEISAKEMELNARQGEYQQMAESMTFDQTL
jgi:hypothetical protein